jgi:hypothetical protein
MGHLEDTAIVNGNPKDIRSQIPQGAHPLTHRLAVNDPILLPNLRRHLVEQPGSLQGVAKLGSKEYG